MDQTFSFLFTEDGSSIATNSISVMIIIFISVLIFSIYIVIPTSINDNGNHHDGDKPKPYTLWNHPRKYKIDKLLSFFFPFVAPFDSLCNEPYHSSYYTAGINDDKNDTSSYKNNKEINPGIDTHHCIHTHHRRTKTTKLERLRKRFAFMESIMHSVACYLWYRQRMKMKKTIARNTTTVTRNDDFLVYSTVSIPRQSDILHKWDIISPTAATYRRRSTASTNCNDENVEIELTCFHSAILNVKGSPTTTSSSKGWRRRLTTKSCQLVELDNITFQTNCPIIIYFHGGGMSAGSSRDFTSIFDCAMNISSIVKLCNHNQKEKQEQKRHRDERTTTKAAEPITRSNENAIVLAVTYRLAPEYKFPNAIIDCLSASSYIIEKYSEKHDIYISGFSAGGNLASVIGMECYRKYVDKIKSIMAIDPMILPNTDTMSYHMNSSFFSFAPAKCMRWFWIAYLYDNEKSYSSVQQDEQFSKYDNVVEYKEFLKKNSIATADSSRLICPQIDLPKSLQYDINAPCIIVRTSTADTLCDDGIDLVRCLRDIGVKVIHIESIGSHGISSIVDGYNFEREFK